MIKRISLKNIALITSCEIDFVQGVNVLSGETGAGKTVIIQAINFVLGAKADKTMIRYGEDFSIGEVVFDLTYNSEVKSLLNEYDIDFSENELIIRRKLTIEGKNEIRINGVSVTLSMLKSITSLLCDVYGQSEHYSLLKESNQLKILDLYCGKELQVEFEKIKEEINKIKQAKKTLEDLGGDEKSRLSKIDLLTYQIDEIQKAELFEGEEDELLAKRKVFSNIEKIGEALQVSRLALSDDNGAIDALNIALRKLSAISDFNNDYSTLCDRVAQVTDELNDVSIELETLLDNLDYNEMEMARVEERLDLYHSLKRKYGNSYDEIIDFYQKSQIELENLQNFSVLANEAEQVISSSFILLEKYYNNVTQIRSKYSKILVENITRELRTLGMNDAKFDVVITTLDDKKVLSSNGVDCISFYFTANKGEPLKTMSKVISGGEMSRFMLSLKLVTEQFEEPITYVFDEIDAGISGVVAQIVAEKFAKLSIKNQIITITHLPQIVSYSDKSFLIEKSTQGETTKTQIKGLTDQEKEQEIVRIIGGKEVSNAVDLARQLIANAKKRKEIIKNS